MANLLRKFIRTLLRRQPENRFVARYEDGVAYLYFVDEDGNERLFGRDEDMQGVFVMDQIGHRKEVNDRAQRELERSRRNY